MKHDDYDEGAPRPISAYLLLGIVVIVVIAGAYAGRDAITALATSAFFVPAESPVLDAEPALQPPAEPECADDCGRACWLTSSGEAEGTYGSSGGAIGILGCDGMCWSISDTAKRAMCCENSECPRGMACRGGACA